MPPKPGTKTSPNYDELVQRLSAKVGPGGTALAKRIVAKCKPDVINLAFRMLPKRHGISTLGKRDQEIYENLKEVSEEQAEKFRAKKLALRSSKNRSSVRKSREMATDSPASEETPKPKKKVKISKPVKKVLKKKKSK